MKGFVAFSAFLHVDRERCSERRLIPVMENATMTPGKHPHDEVLRRFVLGRLDRKTMAEVESHLAICAVSVD